MGELKAGLHQSEVEKMVDEFFLSNLPTDMFRRKMSKGGIFFPSPIPSPSRLSGQFEKSVSVSQKRKSQMKE